MKIPIRRYGNGVSGGISFFVDCIQILGAKDPQPVYVKESPPVALSLSEKIAASKRKRELFDDLAPARKNLIGDLEAALVKTEIGDFSVE